MMWAQAAAAISRKPDRALVNGLASQLRATGLLRTVEWLSEKQAGKNLLVSLAEALQLPSNQLLLSLERCSNEDFLSYVADALVFADTLHMCLRVVENSELGNAPALVPNPINAAIPMANLAFRPAYEVVRNVSLPINHVGLAHEKFCPPGGQASGAFIRDRLSKVMPPNLYKEGYQRWMRATLAGPSWRKVLRLRASTRLLCGTGAPSPSENGLTLHSVYGTPVLPGSSLKGVTRAWCRDRYKGSDWGEGGHFFRELFGEGGDTGIGGAVDFLDALAIPMNDGYFAAEIATPHYGSYYQGREAPDGLESPNPVVMLSVNYDVNFRVVLEGDPKYLERVTELLIAALSESGIGAKTRAGYGRLVLDGLPLLEDEAAKQAYKERALAQLPVGERLLQRFKVLTETDKELIKRFFLRGDGLDETLIGWSQDPGFQAGMVAVVEQRGLLKTWAIGSPKEKELAKKLSQELGPKEKTQIIDETIPISPSQFGTSHWDKEKFPKDKKWNPSEFAGKIIATPFDRETVEAALSYLQKMAPKMQQLQEKIRKHYQLSE